MNCRRRGNESLIKHTATFFEGIRGSLPRLLRVRRAGFTILELIVATALSVVVIGALVILAESTGRTLVSITSQSTLNQFAGNGTEFIIGRVRLANSVTVDASGNTLTLSFDDDPTFDSDGDEINWNDRNHWEEFQYVDTDNLAATLNDNKINYRANTNSTNSVTLIPCDTRKLGALKVFTLTNSTTVLVNFGLLTTNYTLFSQAIEIRTKALLRNRTK